MTPDQFVVGFAVFAFVFVCFVLWVLWWMQ